MAANAIVSKGTKVEINTTGTNYVQIKGAYGISGLGGGSPAQIDVTDFDSTSKEKLPGMPDEGDVSLEMHYLDTDPGQVAVQAARATQAATKFRMTLKNGRVFNWTAYVMTFEVSPGGPDDKVGATSQLMVTGPVTNAAGTP